jgi:DNA-binding CsgD family transcriptional regulator
VYRNAAIVLLFFSTVLIFADNSVNIASRSTDGVVYYYAALHEAVEAANKESSGTLEMPDEITLLADITVHAPLIIEDGKHIRLVADNGNRIMMRGSEFLEYPIFWIRGENASLFLGGSGGGASTGSLIIDGQYLNGQPIQARAPLIAVTGTGAKLIMYDGVILQNNYNNGLGLTMYQFGSGVCIRTFDDHSGRPSEFIMKGGTIRGNTNLSQNPYPFGGGVLLLESGVFTMEGGIIAGNISRRGGGGLSISSTGSFKKTGGIIYGSNAPVGFRNTAMESVGYPAVYGHAVFVNYFSNEAVKYIDYTVRENESLSYTGAQTGYGIFGKGEKWSKPNTGFNRRLVIYILTALVLIFAVLLFVRKKIISKGQKSKAVIEAEAKLTPREKEVFDLFLSGHTAKQLAQTLKISVSSIDFHSKNIYRKLGIQSRTELLVKFKGE